jgi:hypothetical protein
MEERKGGKPTPQPLKTTKPPFPCNSRNNLLKSLGLVLKTLERKKLTLDLITLSIKLPFIELGPYF